MDRPHLPLHAPGSSGYDCCYSDAARLYFRTGTSALAGVCASGKVPITKYIHGARSTEYPLEC